MHQPCRTTNRQCTDLSVMAAYTLNTLCNQCSVMLCTRGTREAGSPTPLVDVEMDSFLRSLVGSQPLIWKSDMKFGIFGHHRMLQHCFKNASISASCSFDKHGLILINVGKRG